MKKRNLLLSSFLCFTLIGTSQNRNVRNIIIPQVEAALSTNPQAPDPDFIKSSKLNSKALGAMGKQISLAHLNKGLYYVSLEDETDSWTEKVIIQYLTILLITNGSIN